MCQSQEELLWVNISLALYLKKRTCMDFLLKQSQTYLYKPNPNFLCAVWCDIRGRPEEYRVCGLHRGDHSGRPDRESPAQYAVRVLLQHHDRQRLSLQYPTHIQVPENIFKNKSFSCYKDITLYFTHYLFHKNIAIWMCLTFSLVLLYIIIVMFLCLLYNKVKHKNNYNLYISYFIKNFCSSCIILY